MFPGDEALYKHHRLRASQCSGGRKAIQYEEAVLVIGRLLEEQDCVAVVIHCAVGGCHASGAEQWPDYSDLQWRGRCPRLVEGTEYKLSDTEKSGKERASAFIYLLFFCNLKTFMLQTLPCSDTPLWKKVQKFNGQSVTDETLSAGSTPCALQHWSCPFTPHLHSFYCRFHRF